MRIFITLFCCIILLACQENKTVKTETPKEAVAVESDKIGTSKVILKDCTFDGNIKEGNQITLSKQHQVLAILADDGTKDATLGESHRVLMVKDQTNCSVVFKETLPINRSADYPYYIADLNYNNTQALVAIKGYDKVYCYDVNQKKMQPILQPKFTNPREAKDAQSGQIIHLELWENYIIGYAVDCGTFVFNIKEENTITAVLPAAEYNPQGTDTYASLFSLPSMNGKTQFLMPRYDVANKQFALNTMLPAPMKLKNNMIVSTDQRYALFADQLSNDTFVIDLLKQARVPLTVDQRSQKPSQILKQLQRAN